MVQCSVSTKGSLFQSMLLLINPNTRLLLVVTAAAGKNVCNFNIFTALLHSILHFSYGTLLVKFQTEFFTMNFFMASQSSLLLPSLLQILSTYQTVKKGPLLSSACSVHTVFMDHLSFLSCLFTPTAFLSFASLLILQTVLGSPSCP